MFLKDEGRRRDVSEEDGRREDLLQNDRDEGGIAEKRPQTRANAFGLRRGRSLARLSSSNAPRLRKAEGRHDEKRDAHRKEEPENPAPTDEFRNERPEKRRGDGCDALYGAHHGHELAQSSSRIAVGRDGARHDDRARGAESFEKAPEKEEFDRGSDRRTEGGARKDEKTREKRPAAPSNVGERSHEQLSDRQPPHRHGKSELHRGRGGRVLARLLRERRQIEVRHEGPEGREHGEKKEKKEAAVLFGRTQRGCGGIRQ